MRGLCPCSDDTDGRALPKGLVQGRGGHPQGDTAQSWAIYDIGTAETELSRREPV